MDEEQQPEAPSLSTLPGNILQDIATRLDGHSLLALLRTCHTLRNSHALRGSLLEAVLQQLGALRAALQVVLEAMGTAQALQQHMQSLSQARPPLIGDPATRGKAARLPIGCVMLMLKLAQERPDLKATVVAQLKQAKISLQQAKAVGQLGRSGQQAEPKEQHACQAQAAEQQLAQGAQPAGRSGEPAKAAGRAAQQAQAVGQELALIVIAARAAAVEALEVQQACPYAEQALQGALAEMGVGPLGQQEVRAVVEVWLEGQDVQQVVAQTMGIINLAQQAGLAVQQAVPAVQQPVQQAAPAGQQAVPAVQQPAQQAVPVGMPDVQAALHALLAGQPEAGLAVQVAVQARAQLLVQFARQTLQDWVWAGQARLQRVGHHHDGEDMSALEATVQAAQRALQA